ncbi:hypothetical protein EG19_01325 [Thermoanaerobaculum aquaticum]|uniref:Uncharacterized protein n=1 Tax=Thermoanaerobaculum aquaticum TaxID=1312852 RepID=A0A062XXA5_9BACT|nr:GTPase domain-containing protein [Thermoanaerobaculum aquaticum]KDA54044.1 hypothetical protein EG19_01325 [Thermoanaerobaculum aquaticum]
MVFFNWATMQMAAKIVYYGPGLCGKTTNLSYIYAKTAPTSRGEMVSLETETDRTLFFDLLPLEVGKVGGFRTRLQLYTVPGQVFYNTTRKLVLKGVDGIVFVADSQRPMADANVESFNNLRENLQELGIDFDSVPLVLQYNKRDLKNILSVEELNAALNPDGKYPYFEAIATQGVGVFETLKAITKLTLKTLRARMATQEAKVEEVRPAAAAPPPPPPAPAPAPKASFSPDRLASAVEQELPPPPVVEVLTETVQPPVEELPASAVTGPAAEVAPEAPPPATPEAEPAVEFATTTEPAPPSTPEVRHVRVSSSLDILAELENLRKASTYKAPVEEPAKPALDLDALLAGSLNSRQEVRKKVEEHVGKALGQAARCRVRIELVDDNDATVATVAPVDVELKRGERVRQLALTLTVNLQGE